MGFEMVRAAIPVPSEEVENVRENEGEFTVEAVRRCYSGGELDHFRREFLSGDLVDVVVAVRLEEPERDALMEKADEAGVSAGMYLGEAVDEAVKNPPTAGFSSFEELVGKAIIGK